MKDKYKTLSILHSARFISLGIFSSRILGLIRDMLMAAFLGTGMGAQAFVVAFRIPNFLRSLVGEGAMDAALVPVFCEYKLKGKTIIMNKKIPKENIVIFEDFITTPPPSYILP